MLQENYRPVKITRFRDSDRGRVPSSVQFRSHYDLVERVNAAIELALPSVDTTEDTRPVASAQDRPSGD